MRQRCGAGGIMSCHNELIKYSFVLLKQMRERKKISMQNTQERIVVE